MNNFLVRLRAIVSVLIVGGGIVFGTLISAKSSIESQIKSRFIDVASTYIHYVAKVHTRHAEVLDYLRDNVSGQLLLSEHSSPFLPLITQTQVELTSFYFGSTEDETSSFIVPFDNQFVGVDFRFHHAFNYRNVGLYAVIGMLSFALLNYLQHFIKALYLSRKDEESLPLLAANFSYQREARLLCQFSLLYSEVEKIDCWEALSQLDERQIQWFSWAYQKFGSQRRALEVAQQPDTLVFNLSEKSLCIRGVEIHLPKTPLFYYYWYAQRCARELPAYTNPAADKPDRVCGQELANIMAANNGVDRTITELRLVGLRSKNLDLNRNKIKEKLQGELGDLAQYYLFETQRDVRTARYQYRLTLNADAVVV